jgi:DNA gyrase/topoisomerase IV subunit A
VDPIRPVKSANAGGVAGMRIGGGDRIVAACVAGPGDAVVLHEGGFGKRVSLGDIPTKGRGGAGVALAAPDKPAREPAGPVAALACPDGTGHAVLMSGQVVPIVIDEAVARSTVSRPVVEVVVGDEVAAVS